MLVAFGLAANDLGRNMNLPAMQETQVLSLGGEGPLEEGVATQSSVPAWRIARTEEPSGLYSPWGHKESTMT